MLIPPLGNLTLNLYPSNGVYDANLKGKRLIFNLSVGQLTSYGPFVKEISLFLPPFNLLSSIISN